MGWCRHVLHSYCGPLITIGVGVGFMLVGAVPVAAAYAARSASASAASSSSSATIIGVGFVGFGALVVLPGLAWCIVRRLAASTCCRCRHQHRLRPRPPCHRDLDADDDVAGSNGFHRHLPALPRSVCALHGSHVPPAESWPGPIYEISYDNITIILR